MHLNLLTSNISAEFLSPPGVPAWDERKSHYIQALRMAQPEVMALQEVAPRQHAYLREQLPEFAALTVPVIDPAPELLSAWRAKYAAHGLPDIPSPYELVLLYRAETFEAAACGHWWLSPTPERPSIGFGNVAPRAVLWAHLRQRASGRELLVFNTHIDRRCARPMVELCRERLTGFGARGLPLIFAGDLNFNPGDENYALLRSDGWRDAHEAAASADSATFLYNLPGIPGGRIDHILYRGAGVTSIAWARLASPDPARRISDHDPVLAQLNLE